jgi:hypothetical protein
VACATQASDVGACREGFKSLGKWRLSRSGKYPVNKHAGKIFGGFPYHYGTTALATRHARPCPAMTTSS